MTSPDPTSPGAALLGAHVSAAGGTPQAPVRAKALDATALQLFTKQGNRWAERICEDEECTAFREAVGGTDVAVTVSHDSYLINLASPDPALRAKSLDSFVSELQRCRALGVRYLVSHPGNFMDERAAGLARNADAISEGLARAPGETILCLETTAGAGTVLGANFEELAALVAGIDASVRHRVGVCLDTCHVYSAGYDLVQDYDGVWARFEDTIGRDRLRVLHLNDSKMPFASKRDRHELIGEGTLGPAPFRRIMTDERLFGIPKIIETPKGDDHTATDRRMLDLLRSYARGE